MWVFNVLTIALCCIMTYKKARLTGECSEGVSQTFHNTFVMINAATIFLSSKYLAVTYEGKLSQWFKKAVFAVGKGTFGIYLWHILVLRLLTRFKIWELFRDKLDLNYMISGLPVCHGGQLRINMAHAENSFDQKTGFISFKPIEKGPSPHILQDAGEGPFLIYIYTGPSHFRRPLQQLPCHPRHILHSKPEMLKQRSRRTAGAESVHGHHGAVQSHISAPAKTA